MLHASTEQAQFLTISYIYYICIYLLITRGPSRVHGYTQGIPKVKGERESDIEHIKKSVKDTRNSFLKYYS